MDLQEPGPDVFLHLQAFLIQDQLYPDTSDVSFDFRARPPPPAPAAMTTDLNPSRIQARLSRNAVCLVLRTLITINEGAIIIIIIIKKRKINGKLMGAFPF